MGGFSLSHASSFFPATLPPAKGAGFWDRLYGIKQNVGTHRGTTYMLTLDCRDRPDVSPASSNFNLLIDGQSVRQVSFSDSTATTLPSIYVAPGAWTTVAVTFTANNPITLLSLVPVNSLEDTTGCLVVNVTLAPVKIVPDSGMVPVVGDVIKSVVKGSDIKHFVTPKATEEVSQEYVILKATGITAEQITPDDANQEFAWDTAVGESVPEEPTKWRVKRDVAGKYPVKIKNKNGNSIVAEMNVWVVWSEGQMVTRQPDKINTMQITNGDDSIGPALSIQKGFDFKFVITPASLFNGDYPNLSNLNTYNGSLVYPPGAGTFHFNSGMDLKGGADSKWDVSRRIREKVLNPSLYTKDHLPRMIGTCWDKQPSAEDIPVSYPADLRLGNDDALTEDEENNPYKTCESADLAHAVGEITSLDSPRIVLRNSTGVDGNTFEIREHFGEFARLLIGGTWFRISEPFEWRVHFKFKRVSGAWVNDGSDSDTNNNGF